MTTDSSISVLRQPGAIDDPLTTVLREGARRLLVEAIEVEAIEVEAIEVEAIEVEAIEVEAIEAEAEEFLQSMREERLADGRSRFVRHGHGPERTIQTGIGVVPVERVEVRDRAAADGSTAERIRFTSAILPKWARRTPSLDALLPVLYLRGVSTGDFQEALAALLGKDAPNLSPSVVARLTQDWQADYDRWQERDLSARRYVYTWADGVYLQARMEDNASELCW